MIRPRTAEGWAEVPVETYKDEPGTWMHVSRRVLFDSEASAFQARVFEVAPGGYTSYERHSHEHFVLVLSGSGLATVGGERREVGPGDVVAVHSGQAHQFENPGDAPFVILCVVDRDRDRPELLGANPLATPETRR
ncbi:MAG: cupin domain-containing protein [Fimbriimonadaceae bacterium]|nr:cupin domain-containing protein [Fimbriimonadaceae bacterium]